ncbi:MAG: Ig-like domain-containing protein [Gemmatimonadaceae bacterium]|nr:Ig-like domain-containing protein [Gemmatimonadaceae bacterium]
MRLSLLAALALAAGCASASPPPGGPEDLLPPKVVRITPDSNAVNVADAAVSFYFDETINDRGTGAQAVDAFFLVSPSDGAPKVDWHRRRIDVRPRNGFRPNTSYTITLRPGLGDLRSNVMKQGLTVTFSTGPTISPFRILGTVFDWAAERVAPRALLEAITSDSLSYLAESDSSGHFALGPLSEGSYLVRAILDQNGNRALDRTEAFDTLRVRVPSAGEIELRAIVRDTLPVKLASVAVTDSMTLKVTFDRVLALNDRVELAAFELRAADSVPVPLRSVTTPREESRAARDSVMRDTAAARPAVPTVAEPGAAKPPAPPRTPSVPGPYNSVTIRLQRPLAPNSRYRLRATGLRSLSGRTVTSELQFNTPRPAPPAAPADTSRRPPAPVPTPRRTP